MADSKDSKVQIKQERKMPEGSFKRAKQEYAKTEKNIEKGTIDSGLVSKLSKKLKGNIEKVKGIKKTYELIQKLSASKKFKVDNKLLHRTLFNSETLPAFGKEYWWFLFIGQIGEKPIQLLFMIFRKRGKSMLFNNKKMVFEQIEKNKFKAVNTCWVWDGKKLLDLGDTNAITTIDSKKQTIDTEISGHKVSLKGSFPDFEVKIGKIINMKMTDIKRATNKDAAGVFLPPFGMGWIDAFSKAKGTVFGKKFEGIGHLQKVVGITTSGCFNWCNLFFEKGSSFSFFCVRPERKLRNFFGAYVHFYDHTNNKVAIFKKSKIHISKKETSEHPEWVITGSNKDKEFRLVLETYALKEFSMKNGGWQIYEEYAVKAKEFSLKSKSKEIVPADLGRGIGTFEDAYGFII